MNKNKNLLEQVESITKQAYKCKLDFTRVTDDNSVKELADFLSISPRQVILFSCILELNMQGIVNLEKLARYLDCKVLKVISMIQDIEDMERKSIVVRKTKYGKFHINYNKIGLTIPHQVIESLRTSDPSLLTPTLEMKFSDLLKRVICLLKEREDENISTKQLIGEIDLLVENNKDHEFVRHINQKLAKSASKCVALALAYHRYKGHVITEIDLVTQHIFDDFDDHMDFRRSLINGNNELLKSGILKLSYSEFAGDQVLELTSEVLKILFRKFPELLVQELSKEGLIRHNSIVEKPLYFNSTLSSQIDDLTKILGKTQFSKFQSFAQRHKLNTGMTAIFHGYSGTGKTEAAFQIAKKTKRDIFMVDLSKVKSMWFGESEKHVKKIFDDYRELVQALPTAPILLINEADGLFSRRLNITASSASAVQTQNTIQNIILQELEVFKGILIGTTNLTGNIDKAFERRFLFMIDFPKPDTYVRQKIWQSKLPELTDKTATLLGERFELTGGQIDNQVRKLLLKRVLNKNFNLFNALIDSCEKEHRFTPKKRIGFN